MLVKFLVLTSMALPLFSQVSPDRIAAHARAAQEAERKNDFATAVHEYEVLLRALPQNPEMQSNLGVALYFNHQLTHALAVFKKAITLDPSLLAPHLFSGLAFYRLSNPDAAVLELEKAITLNPSDAIARTWLGYAYVSQSRYQQAVNEFQLGSQLDPDNVDVWYALGQCYFQIGKDATLQLLMVAPDGGRTWQLAGEQAQLQGDRQRALEDFQGALDRRPDIAELPRLIAGLGGTASLSPGRVHANEVREDELYRQAHAAEQDSRQAFERVAAIAPDSYRAHQIMADVLSVQQRQDEAIAEFRAVLNQKPDLPGVHEAIGKDLVQSGRLDEALAEFQAEIQIQPRSASAHMQAGRVLLMSGKNDEAGKMLTQAIQFDRPPSATYFYLGKLDLRRGDFHGAIDSLNHYLADVKGDSDAYYLLLRAYKAVGDRERMARAYEFYKKTSQDTKARSLAQRELEALSEKQHEPEQTTNP